MQNEKISGKKGKGIEGDKSFPRSLRRGVRLKSDSSVINATQISNSACMTFFRVVHLKSSHASWGLIV